MAKHVTWNDRTVEVLRTVDKRVRKEFTMLAERMVELARRMPPEGSPIAGVHDPRLPERPRKLIGMHGGNNRKSIQFKAQPRGDGISLSIFTTSNYGGYLEFGTSKMVARPYFAPAYEIGEQELKERMPWR